MVQCSRFLADPRKNWKKNCSTIAAREAGSADPKTVWQVEKFRSKLKEKFHGETERISDDASFETALVAIRDFRFTFAR